MSNVTAFCVMVFVISLTLQRQFKPHFAETQNYFMVAILDTTLAVSAGVACDAIINTIFK